MKQKIEMKSGCALAAENTAAAKRGVDPKRRPGTKVSPA
jgi:hypothetical protein